MNYNSENTLVVESLEDYAEVVVFPNKGAKGNLPHKIRKSKLLPKSPLITEGIIPSAELVASSAENFITLVDKAPKNKFYMVTNVAAALINGDNEYGIEFRFLFGYAGGSYFAGAVAPSPGFYPNLTALASNIMPTGDVIEGALVAYSTGEAFGGNYDLWYRIEYKIVDSPV